MVQEIIFPDPAKKLQLCNPHFLQKKIATLQPPSLKLQLKEKKLYTLFCPGSVLNMKTGSTFHDSFAFTTSNETYNLFLLFSLFLQSLKGGIVKYQDLIKQYHNEYNIKPPG